MNISSEKRAYYVGWPKVLKIRKKSMGGVDLISSAFDSQLSSCGYF